VVVADPSIVPPVGFRCSNPDVPSAMCFVMGYALVPQPKVVANVPLPDHGPVVWSEPALVTDGANLGRVYVSTENGHVYMLSP
jgi:hypothetical protein